jgi:cell division protein FtsL
MSAIDPVVLVPKSIDNSQVVREVDPRSSRDLWWLLALVAAMVGGLVLYAWPHLQVREVDRAGLELSKERERLVEENRKLRLEKASLENLRRVEAIATRDLGLSSPTPDRLVVVERPAPLPPGAQLAGGREVVPGSAPPQGVR